MSQLDSVLEDYGVGSGFSLLTGFMVISILVMVCLIIKRAQNMNKVTF